MQDFDNNLIKEFTSTLNIEDITAKCLINCGLTTIEECKSFLHPSFDLLTKIENYNGYKDVVDRIKIAIKNNEKVVIYGDYDCDGVCSTAMLYLFLKNMGLEVDYFIPDRHQDGYGMNIESLEALTEEFLPDLLITVDCGISCIEEVEYIQEALGFDVVITDHHEIPEKLPNCPIFDPHMSEQGYQYLCGAGVVLRIIEGLSSFEESLKYFDIAAIATVADLVPLTKDNRIIVQKGLEILNSHPRKGLELLIKSFTKDKITSTDIAFRLSPRINAVGRLDNTNKLIDLFSYDDQFVLSSLVDEIVDMNNKRQILTKKLVDDVELKLEGYDFDKNPIIVLYDKSWDEGVIGIVAAKIVSDYNHPTLLFTQSEGKLKGSGRSIAGVNIFECISACKSLLAKFGGHPQACGLSLDLNNFDEFKANINSYCKETYANDIFIKQDDNNFNFSEVKNPIKVVKELEMLQPFGEKNRKPTFEYVIQNIGFNKMKPGSPHIICKKGQFQMIGFNMSEKLPLLNSTLNKKIVFDLSLNVYNNFDIAQAIIKNVECIDYDNAILSNYLSTALFVDKSIFKPKEISVNEAIELISNNNYTTAYICYSTKTYKEFIEKSPTLVKSAYSLYSKCPNNSILFNIGIDENLINYKNIVFLDRPISLGYIDEMLLNKDCNVYYLNDNNALNNAAQYLVDYQILGQIYIEIYKILEKNSIIDLYGLYIDIEKKLNVNYNNFVVALYIFLDLKIMSYENGIIKINKSIKNPINNSALYKKLIGE